jgi:hypothetical protein
VTDAKTLAAILDIAAARWGVGTPDPSLRGLTEGQMLDRIRRLLGANAGEKHRVTAEFGTKSLSFDVDVKQAYLALGQGGWVRAVDGHAYNLNSATFVRVASDPS